MKVLITGGCGFLGSNIAAKFISLGEEVVVVDGLFRLGSEQNLAWLNSQAKRGQFRFCRADTADHSSVEQVFTSEGPFDYICHLAGQVAMTTSLSDPRRDLLTNVIGSFNVLEGARVHSPNALLAYSSTNKVYGDLNNLRYQETATRFTLPDFPKGLDESLPLDFASPYGCSKGAADQYFRDWYRNYGLRTVVFRHSSIYGGRQFATYDQGWIGWFCLKALEQKAAKKNDAPIEPFTISGTGKQVRDVLHGDDLIALYLKAYERRDSISGEVFNIGGGIENSLSLIELFEMLCEMVQLEVLDFQKLPRRQSDQDFFVADISKASRILDWLPCTLSRAGIMRMIDWVRQAHG